MREAGYTIRLYDMASQHGKLVKGQTYSVSTTYNALVRVVVTLSRLEEWKYAASTQHWFGSQ